MNRKEFLKGAGALAAIGAAGRGFAAGAGKPLKFLLMADHHIESDFIEGHGITAGKPVYTMWRPGNHAAVERTYRFIGEDPFCRDCDFALFLGDQINTGYAGRPVDLHAELSNYWRTLETLNLHSGTKGKTADFDFAATPWTCTGNLARGMKPFTVNPSAPWSRVIAIQGNHDTGVADFYRDCAFTAGNVRFIGFFASYVGLPPPPGRMFHSTGKISDETIAFIECEMARARQNPAIRHIVLCSHWSIAPAGPDFGWPIVGACKENGMSPNRDRLLALAEKYNCRLYLNGHEHRSDWPVGKAGVMSDLNCGTLVAGKGTGAFAVVEIDDHEARFHVYSRATAVEKDGRVEYPDLPQELFIRTIPL